MTRPARVPEAATALPLYLQIQAALKDRIVSGRYPVGSSLPTEAELCTEFDASRYTIREALRDLANHGYIRRRPRSGTIVLSSQPQTSFVQSVASIEDLFQIAVNTHYVLLANELVSLDPGVAARVGGAEGEEWFRITGVRWDKPGGSPLCYIHSYVPRRFAAIVTDFPGHQGPFYALLEQRSGEVIREVDQEITAIPMPAQAVATLGLLAGSLSLLLLRRYSSQHGTLIASFNWHRADQFTYHMQMHRHADEK